MEVIDFVASQSHFGDHLAPVWWALPPETRGDFYACTRHVAKHLTALGIEPRLGAPREPGSPLLFAGYHDYTEAHPTRPLAYLEHGTGQSYIGAHVERHPSYPGGTQRERIGLFLVPNEQSAAKERALYPNARIEVVGCPRLDEFPALVRPSGGLVVAVAFHWDWRGCPETRWAFPDWSKRILHELRDDPEVTLLGSGHPRAWHQLARFYDREGIETVPDANEVLRRADVLVCDNSSLMFEAQACGLGVVALNARWYRPDVEHGLRFWSRCPRPSLWPTDEPGALARAVRYVADPARRFEQMADVSDLYPAFSRGVSAKMAREALLAWLRGMG